MIKVKINLFIIANNVYKFSSFSVNCKFLRYGKNTLAKYMTRTIKMAGV